MPFLKKISPPIGRVAIFFPAHQASFYFPALVNFIEKVTTKNAGAFACKVIPVGRKSAIISLGSGTVVTPVMLVAVVTILEIVN
jgi:hypothetical protein